MDTLIAAQGAITAHFGTLSERIDALNQRMGQSLSDNATKTAETLGGIQTRLSAIDDAQKNISQLSGQVVSLQEILSDKQTRGAFGQERMEAIVADQLPPDHYEFQKTLSNGARPDCVIKIPNVPGVLVIDSKFPLESFEALRTATSDEEKKLASARVRTDLTKHVKDISEKYLIPGETQTPAILFLPSESIYAELNINFSELVQKARRAQVVIVSPHIFMLAINTIQTLMRDAKMREQAHQIQKEVGELLLDVKRLSDRMGDLRRHFDTTNKDIGLIETSLKKIESRGARIAQADLPAPDAAAPLEPPRPSLQ